MSALIIHALPLSTYGRTCTLALIEKGVPYELDPAQPQSAEQLERHPWGPVPAMTHGDIRLYETLAITSYIDTNFDGPALQPDDPLQRARMNQWISVFIQYLYRPGIDIVLQRLVIPAFGGTTNEDLILESMPKAAKALTALDGALGKQKYFASDKPTLADFFVFPVLSVLEMTAEGKSLLNATQNLRPWSARMAERDSAKKTVPPAL
ncbi:MAG: glutathione S-transferase family protein [Proteobacteria bacterium]|nr:glutathione S-transferase family protein [Pseudomonadota bacterium]MDA1354867.1 glutathione S-transferase family protein [Pseudomonadota bacterium]